MTGGDQLRPGWNVTGTGAYVSTWAWAAEVRGRAPEGLLDSYTSERHPIGAWVLDCPAPEGPAMLVRPDGVVAWVEGDGDLDRSLRRWFGDLPAR